MTLIKEGHNLERGLSIHEKSFQDVWQNPSKPQMLWFKTLKGKGVALMEKSPSGGHGFPLKNLRGSGLLLKKFMEKKKFLKSLISGSRI